MVSVVSVFQYLEYFMPFIAATLASCLVNPFSFQWFLRFPSSFSLKYSQTGNRIRQAEAVAAVDRRPLSMAQKWSVTMWLYLVKIFKFLKRRYGRITVTLWEIFSAARLLLNAHKNIDEILQTAARSLWSSYSSATTLCCFYRWSLTLWLKII